MSTSIQDRIDEDEPPIRSARELVDYFERGNKPRGDWRVGAEFELFLVERASGRAVSYSEPDGIRQLLDQLASKFDWERHYEDGELTTLSRNGSTVSLEPGNQVEFASPPVETLAELQAELEKYRGEIRSVIDPTRFAWVASGVSPIAPMEKIAPGIRRRHALMAEYLPHRCPMGLHMMRATASTQVALDYSDETDAMRKFALGLTLSPLVNAIWANSPLYAGRLTGWMSYRARIWLGMDPDRCGLLPELLRDGLSFERWANFLLDTPLLFHVRDGEYSSGSGATFRDYLERGIDGRFPTLRDWERHLTTVFPEVRMKNFLEFRGADANAKDLALAVPALWKGLIYNPSALRDAEEFAGQFPPEGLREFFQAVARHGLNWKYRGRELRDWAREIVAVARRGLTSQLAGSTEIDESHFLDPLGSILDSGASPAAGFIRCFNRTPLSVGAVIRCLEH